MTPVTAIPPYSQLALKVPKRMRNSPTKPLVPGKPIDASPMNKKKLASKGVCLAMPPNEPSWVFCCRE
jgi:hypothetical protein